LERRKLSRKIQLPRATGEKRKGEKYKNYRENDEQLRIRGNLLQFNTEKRKGTKKKTIRTRNSTRTQRKQKGM
jgi:hypothetical protein